MRSGTSLARLSIGAVSLAAALLASGCGSAATTGTSAPAGPSVTVLAGPATGVGTVLVTSKGYTLYMFVPDKHRAVTCTGICATHWPPLKLPSGDAIVAGPGVKSSLLGSDPDPAAGRVVTYNGWPLYNYAPDIPSGMAHGPGLA